MPFRRKIYDELLMWKAESAGRSAVLIEGARRVGKSTIIEEFAKREYRSYLLIDFTYASQEVRDLFDDLSDLNYLFFRLQFLYNVTLHKRESLVIFDEVQLCPKARQAVKRLVADGRYDYAETGSLISIRKNTKGILIPSEEHRLTMHPMDFEEFRWALGDETTVPMLRKAYEEMIPLGDAVHRKLMRDWRLYMLVGGMPQAVEAQLETNNLQRVDQAKRMILDLYEEDFYKIDPTGALSRLFAAIPAQLAHSGSRYHVSSVIAGLQPGDALEQVAELCDSKAVLAAYHVGDPNVGLSATIDLAKFKLYLADTGLFVTLMFRDADYTENEVYAKLLSDKLPVNLGSVYENVVAQTLASRGIGLFYHTWPTPRSKHNYEIDFLLSRGKKVCPLEVKSSGYKTHASLDAFAGKFSSRVGAQRLVYTKDLRKDGPVTCLPTYHAQFV